MAELMTRLEGIRSEDCLRTWLRVGLIWIDLALMSVLAFQVSLHFLLGNLGPLALLGVVLGGAALIALMNALLDPGTPGRLQAPHA